MGLSRNHPEWCLWTCFGEVCVEGRGGRTLCSTWQAPGGREWPGTGIRGPGPLGLKEKKEEGNVLVLGSVLVPCIRRQVEGIGRYQPVDSILF